jgi:hypothetical protein
MAVSLRQRLGGLTWDLNYTFSKSMDDSSGLQNAGAYGTAFILNPLRQKDNYAVSDFDMRHILNFNSVWELPVGRGRTFLRDSNAFVDAVLGGWQLSTIVRYNTGEPLSGSINPIIGSYRFFDNSGWPTNWNIKSSPVRLRPISTGVHFNGSGGLPTLFADVDEAYSSFRSPYPGESGDRNQLRMPSYFVMDMGLQKQFKMPWSETHKLGFKWEVFNVTNSDFFRWCNLWPRIAALFEMPDGPVQTIRLAEFMSDKAPLWQAMQRRHGLQAIAYDDLVAWPFGDYVFGTDWDVMSDTLKIRRAGFTEGVDSEAMILALLADLRAKKVVP